QEEIERESAQLCAYGCIHQVLVAGIALLLWMEVKQTGAFFGPVHTVALVMTVVAPVLTAAAIHCDLTAVTLEVERRVEFIILGCILMCVLLAGPCALWIAMCSLAQFRATCALLVVNSVLGVWAFGRAALSA